ncbi:MAG TPA: SAM-dependent chlorinase/fluorinase [Pyrinomonadaceae bacterium]|nr:SAM-dependent chlorinase/fluorinase [Pyrinomonadaceae bacterium]
MSLVTLLTDFGTADYFVGALKGAILSVNARARIVDLTHEIPAHDIRAGAFTLLAAYESFPRGTIHVAVVDPGVGSARRPLLVTTHRYFFVGPDNGLFSYVCEREQGVRVYQLTEEKFFRAPVSATFHGRDIFAPVAGALSNNVPPESFGELIDTRARLDPLAPVRDEVGAALSAAIIHIDRFGNLVTNITRRELAGEEFEQGAKLEIGGREINSFRQFYAEGSGAGSGELFAIWGSAGFLEVSCNGASAAQLLRVERGQPVRVAGLKMP